MSVRQDITNELTRAIKAGDRLKVSTLRLVLNSIKNKEIELKHELSDEEVFRILSTLVRQRQESIEQFEKGGRTDLAEKEKKELEVIKGFLPPQLSDEEILEIVKEAADGIGASGMKDLGRLMKAVMPKIKGRADGRTVNAVVKRFLGG